MHDFLLAFALVFVIEGLLYASFPEAMKKMMAEVQRIPPEKLRIAGLNAAGFGVVMIWFLRM